MKISASSHNKIRKLLPKDWRKQIAESGAQITKRQITEVFNQRTTNPDQNRIVWEAIKKVLQNSENKKREELIEEVNKRLFYCNSLDNIIQ